MDTTAVGHMDAHPAATETATRSRTAPGTAASMESASKRISLVAPGKTIQICSPDKMRDPDASV